MEKPASGGKLLSDELRCFIREVMGMDMNMPQLQKEYAQAGTLCAPRQQTIRERLEEQRIELSRRLMAIDEAIAALDSTPDFERVFNAVQKAY